MPTFPRWARELRFKVGVWGITLPVDFDRAAHLRGFEFATVKKNIAFYPYGWIEVQGNAILQSALISLAGVLKNIDLIIENHRDSLFRLSISPEMVCFDEKLFSFAAKQADLNGIQTKILVIIHRESFDTAFGQVKDSAEEFKLTLQSNIYQKSTRFQSR
jgi:hypothetical protein